MPLSRSHLLELYEFVDDDCRLVIGANKYDSYCKDDSDEDMDEIVIDDATLYYPKNDIIALPLSMQWRVSSGCCFYIQMSKYFCAYAEMPYSLIKIANAYLDNDDKYLYDGRFLDVCVFNILKATIYYNYICLSDGEQVYIPTEVKLV